MNKEEFKKVFMEYAKKIDIDINKYHVRLLVEIIEMKEQYNGYMFLPQFEKKFKNDEKVKNFEKAIRTAGNQLIELGEKWLEEDEMNAYQIKKVEDMVNQTKNMLAKL